MLGNKEHVIVGNSSVLLSHRDQGLPLLSMQTGLKSDIGKLPAAASAPLLFLAVQGFSAQMLGELRQENHEPEPKLNRKTEFCHNKSHK